MKKLTAEQKALGAKLTPLQRKCVEELLGGAPSKTQAYLLAGGTSKTNDAQRASAYKIFTNVHVKEYYEALKGKAEEAAGVERTDCLNILVDIMKDGGVSPQHRVAAIKQMSTMEGWDAPKKSELTGKDGKPLALKTEVDAPEVVAALGSLMDKL